MSIIMSQILIKWIGIEKEVKRIIFRLRKETRTIGFICETILCFNMRTHIQFNGGTSLLVLVITIKIKLL
jgi:hypothetical protein